MLRNSKNFHLANNHNPELLYAAVGRLVYINWMPKMLNNFVCQGLGTCLTSGQTNGIYGDSGILLSKIRVKMSQFHCIMF